MGKGSPNGWDTWSKHVLTELERLHGDTEQIKRLVSEINGEIKLLKYKSGIWGAIAGMIPILVYLFLDQLKKLP